jgi:hypothetical protein
MGRQTKGTTTVANILSESEFPHIYSVVHILSHGEGGLKLHNEGEPIEDLRAIENSLRNIPFHVIVAYAYAEPHDPVDPVMQAVDEVVVRQRIY